MHKAAMVFPGKLRAECENELNHDVNFYPASLQDAVQIATKLESNGVEVIISRGGTAEEIRRAVSIPVVICEVSNMDLLDSILDIQNDLGSEISKVALILYRNVHYDIPKIEKILGIEVMAFHWEDGRLLENCILRAIKAGAQAILGAQLSVNIANKYGVNGYLLQVGSETIRQAIQKAKEIINIRRIDNAYTIKLRNIINIAQEGIILINNDNCIEMANPYAHKLLNSHESNLIGKNIPDYLPLELDSHQPNKIAGKIIKVYNSYLMINKIPITLEGSYIGSVITLIDSAEIVHAEHKIRSVLHTKRFASKYNFDNIIGTSKAIKDAIDAAVLFSSTDSTILIHGETGTGKELFANSIHSNSNRNNMPFVALNCAAFPDNLLESEMFGYEDGAFTGARKGGKPGLIELAHGGTIFFDEISEMSNRLQVKLLRVIQEKEIMHIGANSILPVDVRVIAASNKDLREETIKGQFRSDLYHRLNILNIRVPPLRERLSDITSLTSFFQEKFKIIHNLNFSPLSKSHIMEMKNYSWPGNVRELENFTYKYCILSSRLKDKDVFETIWPELTNYSSEQIEGNTLTMKIEPINDMVTNIYNYVYRTTNYSKAKTAKILGVNRNTVSSRLTSK